MARSAELGITGIEAVHFFVNDMARGREFWIDKLDFALIGTSSAEHSLAHGQVTEAYRAGKATYLYTQPTDARSQSGRYLARHPDGVAEIIFGVEDIGRTFKVLQERGAAIVGDIHAVKFAAGSYASFSITTAFGDTLFTFAQRHGHAPLVPGMAMLDAPVGGQNRFGFGEIDHVTSNFMTLKPMILWCKDVLGLEEYWGIEFHTEDVSTRDNYQGSGLKSVVLWDPYSGVKFANNEPRKPNFAKSQIYTFVEDNFGPGIQHTALTIADIVGTVGSMRTAGIEFMPTPGSYYEMLPSRLTAMEIEIDEPIEALRVNEILVDGEGPGKYMLQIFCKDFGALYANRNAGPFFLEIIQRKGDRGFGGGNFRALFESIEREQVSTGRI
jgi:4-hydroxyphenylpyruvate dioxygenase